jgi:sigma-B regulation protein RsbQ
MCTFKGLVLERWSSPTALVATRACGATSPRLFEAEFRTVLFDAVGAGRSDLSAYDAAKYADLSGYADDLIEILQELDLTQTVFVGHSVSAMVGVLASLKAPQLFSKLILVGPSPRYIDDGDYIGGFGAAQIEELLEFLADNPMGWAQAMAPAIIGNPDRPELGEELTESFCRTDPGHRQGVRPRDLYL